jgi:hypothetical protein
MAAISLKSSPLLSPGHPQGIAHLNGIQVSLLEILVCFESVEILLTPLFNYQQRIPPMASQSLQLVGELTISTLLPTDTLVYYNLLT